MTTQERLSWKESRDAAGTVCYVATMPWGITYTAFRKGRAWKMWKWVTKSEVGELMGPYTSLAGAKRAAARIAKL